VQRLLSGLVVLGFAFTLGVGVTGCKKGTNNNTTPVGDTGKVTWTFADSAKVTAGKKATVTLKRDGPKDKLTAAEPTVTVEGTEKVTATATKFEAEKKESTITIEAAADAEPKDYTLKVKVGDQYKGEMKVTVEKAAAGAGKAKYTVEKEEVAVAPGKEVKVKITREGGKMEAKKLEPTGIPEDAKVTVTGGEFEKDGKEATLTIAADAKAPEKEYTLKFKAGDEEHTIKVKVDKKAKAMNDLPRGDFLAQSRRVEILADLRVSFPRQLALFTREL